MKPLQAGFAAVPNIARQIADEPVVVFEGSAPVGRSLTTILSQGGAGYIVMTGGRPFLLVAYEVTVFIIWFAAGPIKGARAGLEEAAHDAAKEVATEVFRDWFRRAFRRRARR